MTTRQDRWAGERPSTAFATDTPTPKTDPHWSPETGYTRLGKFSWLVYKLLHPRIIR
jgi:hypothetical protein